MKINISPISLGTWVFGGSSWGGSNDQDAIDAVHAAIDCGINCIDTAPVYSNGDSERLVGKALVGKRDKVFLATKCGIKLKNHQVQHNLSRSVILDEVEGSLRRLKTEYIDLYQCHWPDDATSFEETFETLKTLQAQGKIRHIGVSNYGVNQIKEASKIVKIETSQDQYSLLDKNIEKELMPHVLENDMGVLAYGPLAGGILTGKYKQPPEFKDADARTFFYKYYKGQAFEKTSIFLDQLRQFNKPLNQLAINWVRQQKGVLSVLVGCRNRAQVEENIKALQWNLSDEEMDKINNKASELVYD
jgi:methylglyoxal reductase